MKIVLILLLGVNLLFGMVDINSASGDELLKLNGIGQAKSQKIIAYREVHKCFKSVDELADIDGISSKLIEINRYELKVGPCANAKIEKPSSFVALKTVLLDPINVFFVVIMFALAILDYKTSKDFKSQIVSVGVLGTFVGIFIGLQAFNPEDITNSVGGILVGLKTAFFTSIVGMTLSTLLSVVEQFRGDMIDEK